MMAARPRGTERTMVVTLLLLSLTLLPHMASTEVNTIDRRSGRFSAQIAHHTELPYIRDPPEPSNVVDGPLPDEFEVPETSSIDGGDTALSTESDTNDESNEIHAADGLGVHGEVLSLRPQNDAGVAPESLVVPNSQRPSPVAPYDSRNPPKLYAPLHERYRLPERPFSYVRTFQCDFEEHACGMRNQKNIGDHFKLVSNSIAGRRGRYMAVDSQTVPAGVSRLITPYLPGYPNSMVCLRLAYFVHGPGAERIQIVAQDMGNRPLFSLERHQDNRWQTFAHNMTLHQDLRFFIEAYTNGQPGLIAIDDFTYSFDPCRR
uniref:MAM domain-containing protein n=1 Tax=Rhipicephalus appendiculatus TaxID=34631 RepID=A0A131YMK0_RHIAP